MDDTRTASRHIASRETTDVASLGLATAAAAVRNGDITSGAYTAPPLQRARSVAGLKALLTIRRTGGLAGARGPGKTS